MFHGWRGLFTLTGMKLISASSLVYIVLITWYLLPSWRVLYVILQVNTSPWESDWCFALMCVFGVGTHDSLIRKTYLLKACNMTEIMKVIHNGLLLSVCSLVNNHSLLIKLFMVLKLEWSRNYLLSIFFGQFFLLSSAAKMFVHK